MDIAIAAARIEPTADESRLCLDGNKNHVWRVFDACSDGLYRFILFRVGGNRNSAEDLLQQTCTAAAGNNRSPTDDGACEAWLRGIARNLVRLHWRQNGRNNGRIPIEDAELSRQLAEDMDARPLPPDVLAKRETVDQLMLAVTSLPAADQQLIFAFYFEGRPQADIAKELGTTVKSIETKLYRARNRLREVLRRPERTDQP